MFRRDNGKFKKESSGRFLHFSVARVKAAERSQVMCIGSEEPRENTKCPSDLLLQKLHLDVQSEKGTKDKRAQFELKPAQPITCSLPISIHDNVDHLGFKQRNPQCWVHCCLTTHSYNSSKTRIGANFSDLALSCQYFCFWVTLDQV